MNNGTVPDTQKAFNKLLGIIDKEKWGYKASRMHDSRDEIVCHLQKRITEC